MDKKLLQQLVDYSYINNKLSVGNVNKVVKLLKNRRELFKRFVKDLKKRERSLTVFIDIPIVNFGEYKSRFEKIFPNKKIVWNVDPSLILGVRITEDDNLLEMSFKNTLGRIVSKIEENYD